MNYINILLLILFPLSLWGQVQPHQAPLNPDFVNQSKKVGYVHPPYKITHNTIKTKDAEILPASYDLRDVDGQSYVSDIRNQNPYGTCWTFATFASVESAWKVAGDAEFVNLSEGNMAKCHGYIFDIDSGGNEYMATGYLTRLAGPVYESADPYDGVSNMECPSIDKTTDIPAYIDNVLWLGNDRDLIKKTLMTYGVVSTSMQALFSDEYYNPNDYTFYYTGTEGVDHGVSIVGWDDNKVITGGTAGSPENNGAWIIRNSWGINANDSGYFYASYEDVHIGKNCELYYGKTSVSEIDTLFDYAKLGAITSYNGGDASSTHAYAAVKHHANTDYFITHIGAAILNEGTSIDITLCRNFDGLTFTDTIAHTDDVFCTYAGYQKIEFPAIVSEGDFYLIVRYETPNSTYPLPAEIVVENYANPEIEEGKLWVSADAVEWEAGGLNTNYEFDLAVKVIAKHIGEVQPYFSANKTLACLNQDITFENKTIGEADSFLWYFPEDTFISNNNEETINVSFDQVGKQKITLVAYKDGVAYSFTRETAIEIVSQIQPNITVVSAAEYYSKGNSITLIASGGDSYEWYAEGYLNGETGRSITFSPNADSLWVRVEATMGNCFESDSVLIRMVDVPYDNIEDALLLPLNTPVDGINNTYASVQSLEPTPPTGSCESQKSWCAEGGLQNTLWFKFVAPSNGKATITTSGFDNQIALYDATATGTWQDIMSGDASNYSILAANDDYHNIDYSAKIEEVSGLTVGKTYWVQMDGSAGGSVGSMRITLSSTGISLSESNDVSFKVINTSHEFRIDSEEVLGASVSIINSIGQIVYSSTVTAGGINTSDQQFSKGFYIINIKNQNINKTYKIVIADPWQLSIGE